MADIYNVVRGDGVFFEGMTKEQIYELIAEMTGETVQDIDQAFITKLKEINKGNSIRLWVGTSAEYNALTTRKDDVLYICTDDTFVSDTNASIVEIKDKIQSNYDSVEQRLDEQNDKLDEFQEQIESLGTAIRLTTSSYTFANNNRTRYTVPSISVGEVRKINWTTPNKNSYASFTLPSSGSYLVMFIASNHYQWYYNDSDSYGWTEEGKSSSSFYYADGGSTIGGIELSTDTNYGASHPNVYYGEGTLIYWRIG